MATSYAPYSDAMRLGQGFNSYTQDICIDSAVVFDPARPRSPQSPLLPRAENQNQTVTYSEQFVDKLSDVVEATNLSPSTSIKSGSIGGSGKGGGGFIDCDKFKESDLNYLVYVKVVNQALQFANRGQPRFQRVKGVPVDSFTRVFGDCYISGFLDGGEFTALINFKMTDEAEDADRRRWEDLTKAALATLKTGNASKEAQDGARAHFLAPGMEVTVQVNWSGGGRLKDEDEKWDIDTVLRVAARFPDLVHRCPQRVTAVLSKYTSIRSFVEQMPSVVPLDYGNTTLYSGVLLDSYMEYKHIVKKLNQMIETLHLSKYQEAPECSHEETIEGLKPIRLTYSELEDAKNHCRSQMMRILKEVDLISQNPDLAINEDHEQPFDSSELFATMLPIRKPRPPATSHAPTPTPQLHDPPLASYHPIEQSHLTKHAHLSPHFLLSPRVGPLTNPSLFTSQLPALPTDSWPTHIKLFTLDQGFPSGFVFTYPTLGNLSVGTLQPRPTSVLQLRVGEMVVAVEVVEAMIDWGQKSATHVAWVKLVTNMGVEVEAGNVGDGVKEVRREKMRAPDGGGLKGVFGVFDVTVDALGFVWGRGGD